MSKQQLAAIQTAKAGLSSANKNNPFWSKSDAFSLLNLARKNAKKGA